MFQLRKILNSSSHRSIYTLHKSILNNNKLSALPVYYFTTKGDIATSHGQYQMNTERVQKQHRTKVEEILPKIDTQEVIDQRIMEKVKQVKHEFPDNFIIKIPPNINTFKLARLFNVEARDILKKIQTLSKEVYSDEFQILSRDSIELAAIEFDREIEFIEDPAIRNNYKPRPPIVTIMGHVDHGKTTLLDSFRHSQRVNEEYGQITQSIGAFTITTDSGHEVTFIDTPGHEAFQSMRQRGAKVTDLIILVISAIESVQPQTIEVIELAKSYQIPLIVAVNKIDRPAADYDQVLLDLSSNNLIPEELGGDVVCVPISAKLKIGIDKLETKIVELSEQRLTLQEDYNVAAQCFVIESRFDEKTTQITASVIVKKGTLKVEDIFVCGVGEGKVRFMIDDKGKNIKQATPGQAVLVGGFKVFPEAGTPLYSVESHDEAQFIVHTVKSRREKEAAANYVDPSKKIHDLQKSVGKYSAIERRKIAGGDKIIFYEKLGLVEEKDIEVYRKKLGIAKNVDLDQIDVDELLSENTINSKRKRGTFAQAKKDFDKEEFKRLISKFKEEKDKVQKMDEEEALKYKMEKSILKEAFRNEEIKHFPVILKASTAGALETLLAETEKIIHGLYRINVIDYSVGPLSEADITSASQTGAVIFGFDIPVSPNVAKMADPSKVPVRLHKIIYKFIEDVENFTHDVKQEIAIEEGKAINTEVVGVAKVSQIFRVKGVRGHGNKVMNVAGSHVNEGVIARKHRFRLVRNDLVIADGLKLSSLKKFSDDVGTVEKGSACGICFDNYEGEIMVGDIIECYKDVDATVRKFNAKPGIHMSY